MKVTLVIPSGNDIYYTKGMDLGLGYLATQLRKCGIQVNIIDSLLLKYKQDDLIRHLINEKPDIVGFKVYTKEIDSVKRSVDLIKDKINTLVIIGGPHPSGAPYKFFETFPKADYGFCGEAELGLPKLVEMVRDRSDLNFKELEKIEGLIWQRGNDIQVNPRGFINNLDKIGRPAWDIMNPKYYPLDRRGFKYIPLMATRGCPYRCSYCAMNTITGRKLRFRSVENIIEELKFLKTCYQISNFSIIDDNFTIEEKFVKILCKELIKSNLNLKWDLSNGVRLDTLNKEIVKLMENAGCFWMDVAIESGSQRILNHMYRKIDLITIYEKVKLIKKVTNIKIVGYFIIGYPEEDRNDILDSINFSKKLKLDEAAFFLFSLHPGTKISDSINAPDIDPSSFSYNKVTIATKFLNKKSIKLYYLYAYFLFYFRWSIILNLFTEINSFRHFTATLRRIINILLMR